MWPSHIAFAQVDLLTHSGDPVCDANHRLKFIGNCLEEGQVIG